MTVIAVCSTKHSPGATTLALALHTAWSTAPGRADDGTSPLLVEADPAGGDLGARMGFRPDPGVVSLAASARHQGLSIDIAGHAQTLPFGGRIVPGPPSATQAEPAVASIAPGIGRAVESAGGGVIDCGRWVPSSPATPCLRDADVTLVTVRPDAAGIAHLRARKDALLGVTDGRLVVVSLGESPYGPTAIEEAIGLSPVLVMAADRAGAASIHGTRSTRAARRTPLVRSARSILDAVTFLPSPRVPA